MQLLEFWEDVRNGIAGLYVWCETTSNLSVLSINPVSTMSGTGKPIKFTQRTMWAPQNPSCSIPEASEYRYRVMKLFDTYCKSGVPMSLYNTLLVVRYLYTKAIVSVYLRAFDGHCSSCVQCALGVSCVFSLVWFRPQLVYCDRNGKVPHRLGQGSTGQRAAAPPRFTAL